MKPIRMTTEELAELQANGAEVEPVKVMPRKVAEFEAPKTPVVAPVTPAAEIPSEISAARSELAIQGMMEQHSAMMQRIKDELKDALGPEEEPSEWEVAVVRDPKTGLMTKCKLSSAGSPSEWEVSIERDPKTDLMTKCKLHTIRSK